MKKIIAIMLSLVLTLSLTSCGKREYVSSEVNAEKNVVVVKLKDNSKENQDAFIHNVFTISTGSTYIKYNAYRLNSAHHKM